MNTENLKKNATSSVDLDTLPNEITARVQDVIEKKDKKGSECIFVYLGIGEDEFAQKYSPYHYEALAEALIKLGLSDTNDLKGKSFKWTRVKFEMGNTRYLPIALV